MVRCHDATASSFVAKVQGEVFAHFHTKLQQYVELTVWPARTNYLRTISSMPKKMMSMLLTLLFTGLAFFGLSQFGLSVYGSYFLPGALV
jgi:hypothetical protein